MKRCDLSCGTEWRRSQWTRSGIIYCGSDSVFVGCVCRYADHHWLHQHSSSLLQVSSGERRLCVSWVFYASFWTIWLVSYVCRFRSTSWKNTRLRHGGVRSAQTSSCRIKNTCSAFSSGSGLSHWLVCLSLCRDLSGVLQQQTDQHHPWLQVKPAVTIHFHTAPQFRSRYSSSSSSKKPFGQLRVLFTLQITLHK